MRIPKRNDDAVSPIIATILLIAITVTLVSAAFTIISGYIPSPGTPTPTASFSVSNLTTMTSSGISGNYSVNIDSFNGNLSFNNCIIEIVMQNDSVIEANLGSVYTIGGQLSFYSGQLVINLSGDQDYISSATLIVLTLKSSASYVEMISLKDIKSGGTIGTITL